MPKRALPARAAGSLRALSTDIDRLDQAGYIRRRADAADRRRLVVETTAATAARDREVFGDLIRQTGELLATYTDDQLAVIDDFLTRARHLTAAYADTLSGRHGSAATGQPPIRG